MKLKTYLMKINKILHNFQMDVPYIFGFKATNMLSLGEYFWK